MKINKSRLFLGLFTIILLFFGDIGYSLNAQSYKKTMGFDVFDGWKSIEAIKIARNGRLMAYEINPQEGDGLLYIYDIQKKSNVFTQSRGKRAFISADGSFLAYHITAHADTIRNLKLKKTQPDKMPKDSIGIFMSGNIKRYPNIKEFKIPEESGQWIAIHFDKSSSISSDNVSNKKKKGFKPDGGPLVFLNPIEGDSLRIEHVQQFAIAKSGNSAYVIQSLGDSIEYSSLLIFNPETFLVDTLMKVQGKMSQLVTSKKGDQCAFLFSSDTINHRAYSLYYFKKGDRNPVEILSVDNKIFSNGWCASVNSQNWFSDDGSMLFFGVAPKPKPEPKDSLTEDEKVFLDVWAWTDNDIQPKQKARLKQEKERTWLVGFDAQRRAIIPLSNEQISRVVPSFKGDARFALGFDDSSYRRYADWMGGIAADVYKVDLFTGSNCLLLENHSSEVSLSPNGNYLVYFHPKDSSFFVMNTLNGVVSNLTITAGVSFYDELNDVPNLPGSYGIVGWTKDGNRILINDRFDVWLFDLKNNQRVNLTNGRTQQNRYRYIKLNPDEKFIDINGKLYFSLFNENDKQSGMALYEKGKVRTLFRGDYSTDIPIKAIESNWFIIRRGTFERYPEIELTDHNFRTFKTITETNPQQNDYFWGKIQQVNWHTPMGKNLQGLLVTPENFDPDEKYPMLVYFYERSSDRIHQHSVPRPSRSTINWPFCASNGYIVFVPDVTYTTGDPGASAYDAIVSGTLEMIKQFPYIDSTRMALQGQSWGGYQTAWLITQTNLYRCAMAGAPVSNMTSAYGGIRWQTGMSRMFQYERTQSRIGTTLWDNLNKYIENSPLFYAPNVETPLLMMHNDNDGAVPWYQGIEFFMALRRLNKPVWMLVYNNEEHNLVRRANTKDLTIRMMQFFDYYLKNASMPVWMRVGIPALEKGRNLGYEL